MFKTTYVTTKKKTTYVQNNLCHYQKRLIFKTTYVTTKKQLMFKTTYVTTKNNLY